MKSDIFRMIFGGKKKKGEGARIAEAKRLLLEQTGVADFFDYTLCRPSKLMSLGALARVVQARGVSGDFVECGTYKGGSSAYILSQLSDDTNAWLYDSFQGMPEVRDVDGLEAKQWEGACVAKPADVSEVLEKTGVDLGRVTIREGWFAETFQQALPTQIKYLHIDADWYDSVLLALETFYPLVVPGGVIVLDDFGHWEGCRHAFYEYCNRANIRPLLDRFENDQAFWFKGVEHNRDGWIHKAL